MQDFKKSYKINVLYLLKINVRKFHNNSLKTVGEDKFLMSFYRLFILVLP